MPKLAHSHQPTMAMIEALEAARDMIEQDRVCFLIEDQENGIEVLRKINAALDGQPTHQGERQ